MSMTEIEPALRRSGMTTAATLTSSSLRVTRQKSTTQGGRTEDFACVERQICLKVRQPR
jgi:hypothetical protein